MIRSQHENRKPFAPNSLKIPTRQHRCNKAVQGDNLEALKALLFIGYTSSDPMIRLVVESSSS
jgi:hypothetical protein